LPVPGEYMTNALYEQGDWIVHAQYGVGEVRGVDRKTMNGVEITYLRVRTSNGEYWLPREHTDVDYIRPVSSTSTFRKALSTIRKKPEELDKDHKARAKEIANYLATGALIRVARLIRDLHGRARTQKLNMSEEDVLIRIRNRFIDEWVVAARIDKRKAEAKLDEALNDSVSKLELE
jgi:RNA polymerase-interacting CarD/CdnL/TRCF family regulator